LHNEKVKTLQNDHVIELKKMQEMLDLIRNDTTPNAEHMEEVKQYQEVIRRIRLEQQNSCPVELIQEMKIDHDTLKDENEKLRTKCVKYRKRYEAIADEQVLLYQRLRKTEKRYEELSNRHKQLNIQSMDSVLEAKLYRKRCEILMASLGPDQNPFGEGEVIGNLKDSIKHRSNRKLSSRHQQPRHQQRQ